MPPVDGVVFPLGLTYLLRARSPAFAAWLRARSPEARAGAAVMFGDRRWLTAFLAMAWSAGFAVRTEAPIPARPPEGRSSPPADRRAEAVEPAGGF